MKIRLQHVTHHWWSVIWPGSSSDWAAWIQASAAIISVIVIFSLTWRSNYILNKQLDLENERAKREELDFTRRSVAASVIVLERVRSIINMLEGIVAQDSEWVRTFVKDKLYKGLPDEAILASLPPELCLLIYRKYTLLSYLHNSMEASYIEDPEPFEVPEFIEIFVKPAKNHLKEFEELVDDILLWVEYADPEWNFSVKPSEKQKAQIESSTNASVDTPAL